MAAPAEKKQKTEETPQELEEDAKRDPSPKVAKEVVFLTPDTTMNVLPSTVGNMLASLTEGGLSQLVAGARANVGVKSGRHMFEAKIVAEGSGKGMVRVGFAAEGSLFLGEDDNSISFDNEGKMNSNRKHTRCGANFHGDVMVAVVLNLDEKSPNANTISLFKNGKRACQPQPLPEELKGKTLFPAVSFKNATVHVNFAAPVVPLPFKCKMVSEATAKDGVVTKYAAPEGGKYTALFPVSLPDEGSFDWLDAFLEKNADYTEISDRAFTDWAIKSGAQSSGKKGSNDKPDQVSLDNPNLMKKLLMEVAAMQPRNFVIMEVKGNLIKEEREKAVARFSNEYKTVAEVIASDPPSSFKRIVQAKTLKVKQDASDREHKLKHMQELREWKVKKTQKEQAKNKAKREKELAKKTAEAKKLREVNAKKTLRLVAEKRAKAEGKELPAEEEEAVEAAVESEEEADDEPMDPEPVETEGPKVSLTAEEKTPKFFAHPTSDLTTQTLALNFTKFSLPEDSEFNVVKYSWAKEKEAHAYVKSWITEKKQTTRVEDISPSAWFKQKNAQWNTAMGKWKQAQSEYKGIVSKKAAAKTAKAARKLAAEKKATLEAEKAAKAKEEGKEVPKAAEKAEAVVEEESEAEEAELDFDGVDVFGVDDILDVGSKVPIFKEFQNDDFAMMALRFELHLLVHSFSKDCNDPDRTGIHLDHLPFYYQKYYGKPLNLGFYGVQKIEELMEFVDDTITVTKQSCIESVVPGDLETNAVFPKITEVARRHRKLLVDMGEESAKLKIKGSGENGGNGGGSWKQGGNGGGWGGNSWGRKW